MVAWSQLSDNILSHIPLTKDQLERNPVSVLLAGGAVLLAVAVLYHRQNNLPPGPAGWPFLGAIQEFGEGVIMHKHCMTLAKRYGSDIISFRLGGQLLVILNGYNLIKEAFVTRPIDFADRPKTHLGEIAGFNDMIFSPSYSEKWRADKKFAMTAFRKFGLGSNSLEDKIRTEMTLLLDELGNSSTIELRLPIQRVLTRVITSIVYNSEYSLNDPEVDQVIKMSQEFLEKTVSVQNHRVALMALPKWMSELFFGKTIKIARDTCQEIQTFMLQKIAEHRQSLDHNNLRDMVDVFLADKDNTRDWTEENLASTLILFLPDAIDTLSSNVLWAILYIIKNPEIQAKIHEELDRVVGKTNQPTLSHKSDMKFLQATILEVFRITTSAPFATVHKASKDNLKLRGYYIPKNAVVLPNLYSVHMDPSIFPNPETFDPSRFLDKDGELTKTEYCIPFSTGRRMCLGEQLSKMEMFLLLANVFHHYSFTFPADQPDPPVEAEQYGFTLLVPKSYRVCPQQRM